MGEALKSLIEKIGSEQVLSTPEDIAPYSHDWTPYFDANASGVVFPRSTEDVQAIVHWARQHQVALVPSGGRTGLSGAATALNGEVIVSFEKMNRILNFDAVDSIVTCEAGVITENLQNYAQEKGYLFPVSFAAQGSSQIGGNIATNAGGVKVVRYGSMRQWVTGLKVVTGQGDLLNLNQSLIKNATGIDFRHLFIGSEGTLGFIVEADLKVTHPVQNTSVLLLGLDQLTSVTSVFQEFQKRCRLQAFELFSDLALKYVIESSSLKNPLTAPAPFYILVEVELPSEKSEEKLMEGFEFCLEQGWISDGAISQSETQARDFWQLRENISESLSPHTPYKNDVSVRISQVPAFMSELDQVLKGKYPRWEVVWFGHIGDGNLHINILKPEGLNREEFLKKCHEVDHLVFSTVQKYNGSISAEHGVGLTKKKYLHYTRSQEEIELMRGIKSLFDPDNILNPGKVFDSTAGI